MENNPVVVALKVALLCIIRTLWNASREKSNIIPKERPLWPESVKFSTNA